MFFNIGQYLFYGGIMMKKFLSIILALLTLTSFSASFGFAADYETAPTATCETKYAAGNTTARIPQTAAQPTTRRTAPTVYASEKLSLNFSTISLMVGQKYRIKPNCTGISDPSALKFTLEGSGAEIDGSGLLTAKSGGVVKVTVTSPSGLTASGYIIIANTQLMPREISLGRGESVNAANFGLAANTKFVSYNTGIASTTNGKITAVSKGKAMVAVILGSQVSAVTVNVCYAPSVVSFSMPQITIGVGEKVSLKSFVNAGAASYNKKYYTNNASVAGVGLATGMLNGQRPGTATITVVCYNGVKTACRVTVKPAPSGVQLNKSSLTLGTGEQFDLDSYVNTGSAAYSRKYYSNSPSIASVNMAGGLITAGKPGVTYISLVCYNGVKAYCKVTVKAAPTSVRLNKSSLTLGVGEKYDLDSYVNTGSAAYNRKYTVANSGIASVAQAGGIVTARRIGVTTVTLTCYNGVKTYCNITVKAAPQKVRLNKSSLTLSQGGSFDLDSFVNAGAASQKRVYKSSNTRICTVDSNGIVKAKLIGSATITLTCYNGVKTACKVTVKSIPVPYVSQLPKYPSGCEAASCTMVLKSYGFNISLDQMINAIPRGKLYTKNGQLYGPDMNYTFAGTPTGHSNYSVSSRGYGIFAPGVTNSLQNVINQRGGGYKAVNVSGCSFDQLLSYVSEGKPVIVWATYLMQPSYGRNSWKVVGANGKTWTFSYPKSTHVMVLSGCSANTVTCVDPYGNNVVTHDKSLFRDRWNLLGNQAIILQKV